MKAQKLARGVNSDACPGEWFDVFDSDKHVAKAATNVDFFHEAILSESEVLSDVFRWACMTRMRRSN